MKKTKTATKTSEKFALLSVYDKSGIVELAKGLSTLGYKVISTGGTAKVLVENRIKVVPIEDITGNPESFDGRMKTISFAIESGILFDRSKSSHVKQAKDLNVKPIDIVICNLYPFEKTVSKKNVPLDMAIENIDVGGPTMVRAAAKNFKHVLPVVDPADYPSILGLLKSSNISLDERQKLAAKAFYHLSFYDSQIAHFFSKELFPEEVTIPLRKKEQLRYGENPHQQASLYLEPGIPTAFNNLEKQAGRELSFVNVTDMYAGMESVRLFQEPAAVVIKHNTPCGIALGKDPEEALKRAIEADPESAFGGVIIQNQPLNMKTAKVIASFKDERRGNIDILAAPEINSKALEFLKTVRKTMGIYTFGKLPSPNHKMVKWIDGAYILQTSDIGIDDSFKDWKIVTEKKPTKKQLEQMEVGWKFISRIRSNAIIIIDKNLPMTRGIGTGQTSRVRSTRIALEQAGEHVKNAILVSDSFFPFDDSVKLAAKYGVGVILQQGGSINDKASIAAANEAGIPMVFTGRRAFWH